MKYPIDPIAIKRWAFVCRFLEGVGGRKGRLSLSLSLSLSHKGIFDAKIIVNKFVFSVLVNKCLIYAVGP